MDSRRIKGWLLVIIQFMCIVYLLWATPIIFSLTASVLLLAGFVLILWAVLAMRKSKLRILPQPAMTAVLITSGPYRFIRHPMYTALITGALGLIIMCPSIWRILTLVILTITLFVKLTLEEKMLAEKFPQYRAYQKKTYRLIPLII